MDPRACPACQTEVPAEEPFCPVCAFPAYRFYSCPCARCDNRLGPLDLRCSACGAEKPDAEFIADSILSPAPFTVFLRRLERQGGRPLLAVKLVLFSMVFFFLFLLLILAG